MNTAANSTLTLTAGAPPVTAAQIVRTVTRKLDLLLVLGLMVSSAVYAVVTFAQLG